MADGNVWVQTITELLTLLRANATLATVQVSSGHMGDLMEPQAVWIDTLHSDGEIALIGDHGLSRDDEFTIPLEVRVINLESLDATRDRVAAIIGAIEIVVASNPWLANITGAYEISRTKAQMTVGRVPAVGFMGFGEIVLAVKSRLT